MAVSHLFAYFSLEDILLLHTNYGDVVGTHSDK